MDTTTNQNIPELFQNAILLEAEMKLNLGIRRQKLLTSYCRCGDTVIEKIKPLNHRIEIMGASSDRLMIDLKEINYRRLHTIFIRIRSAITTNVSSENGKIL